MASRQQAYLHRACVNTDAAYHGPTLRSPRGLNVKPTSSKYSRRSLALDTAEVRHGDGLPNCCGCFLVGSASTYMYNNRPCTYRQTVAFPSHTLELAMCVGGVPTAPAFRQPDVVPPSCRVRSQGSSKAPCATSKHLSGGRLPLAICLPN